MTTRISPQQASKLFVGCTLGAAFGLAAFLAAPALPIITLLIACGVIPTTKAWLFSVFGLATFLFITR